MGTKRQDPKNINEDEIENESAAPLPSREAMSIIDVTPGPKIPYQPPDGFAAEDPGFSTDQGINERDSDA
jgi:hypothetical protein